MCDDRNRCAPDECRRIDGEDDDATAIGAAALLKPRSKSLSSSILDYYTRYGQNRDLEKYFRYRRHNATTGQRSSSDESSVFVLAASSSQQQIATTDVDTSREVFVSSQSLNRSRAVDGKATASVGSQSARSEGNHRSSDRIAPAASKPRMPAPGASSRSDTDLSSARKSRTHSKGTKSAASRSLYSLTSNIEINISNLDVPADRPAAEDYRFWRESSSTQTSTDALVKNAANSETTETVDQSQLDVQQPPKAVSFSADPLVFEAEAEPPISLDAHADLSLTSGPRPSSANSSIVSMATAANKPRLEWDSLADVGYEKSSQTDVDQRLTLSEGGVAGPMSLSTFERAALQKFFDDRGLAYDDGNLLATLERAIGMDVDKASGDGALQAVEEIEEEITLTEENSVDVGKDQVAAEFPKSPITSTEIISTSTISRLFATADAVSTPKPRSVESKSARTPDNPVASVAVQMSPERQVDNSSPAFDQTPPQRAADDADTDDASNASSFKFVRGSPRVEPQSRSAVENEENIAPAANVQNDIHIDSKNSTVKPSGRSKSRSTRTDASAAASSQYDSQTDEIIRTIMCSTTSDQSSVEPSVLVADAANSSAASAVQNSSSSRNSTMMQDLQRGIELLDQLVESERLNKATKKRLVKKIVNGLLRAKYNISSTSLGDDDTTMTSTTNLSAASKRSAPKRLTPTVTENPPPTSAANSNGISSFDNNSPAQRSVDAVVVATAHVPPIARSASSSASMHWLKPLTRSELDYEKHRQRQHRQQPRATKESVKLQWIQKEIQQLVNLQDFLVHKQQQQSDRDRRMYENTGLDRNASTSTDNYYCEVAGGGVGGVESIAKYNSSTTTYASTKNSMTHRNERKLEAPLSTGVGAKHKQHHHHHQHGAPLDDSSDSPLIVQKFVRNRTKLRTPCTVPHDTDVHVDDDDDALNAYARSKQREFLKQYTQTGRPISSQDERTAARDLIYAHPYGEPPLAAFHRKATSPTNEPGHHHHHMHQSRHRANSRSNSSGNTFLSSNSVSIPDMQSSSYPEVVQLLREPRTRSRRRSESVAIQTSDSLLKPILKQQRQMRKPQDATSTQPAPPMSPVFYTITFDNWATQPAAAQSDIDVDAPTAFTVQQCLRDARPRFLIAANRRRDCVRELNALRRQRNAERQRVFQELHVADDDVGELCRRLRSMEAPEPLAQRRCFSTRELLAATRQKCRQLPEVRARSAEERLRRERRAQRLLRDVYGRELQRRALLGRVNLSNSVMVTN